MTYAHDIIGDVHGQADKLEALLRHLGYRLSGGTWRHSSRLAVFVGDFVDRGPDQRRTVDLARRIVDAGTALATMGNHEFNAIAWHTPDPQRPGEFLRPHTDRHARQHAAFLQEVASDPALHEKIIDWCLSLPLWLELPGLHVVHACWHAASVTWLAEQLGPGRRLTREQMVAATAPPEEADHGPTLFTAVECLLKGLEVDLPPASDRAYYVNRTPT